jgi:hypothetical protein
MDVRVERTRVDEEGAECKQSMGYATWTERELKDGESTTMTSICSGGSSRRRTIGGFKGLGPSPP